MNVDPEPATPPLLEMSGQEMAPMIGAFFRAVGWGSVAGSGLFLILTVPFGLVALIGDGEPGGLFVSLLPLALGFAGTFCGMIILGLPLTALLGRLGLERQGIYVTAGILGGLLLPMLFAVLFEGSFNSGSATLGIFLAWFGAMAGGVSGHIWGSYREDLTRAAEGTEEPPINPYHDMIY